MSPFREMRMRQGLEKGEALIQFTRRRPAR